MGNTKRWTPFYPEGIAENIAVEHANLPQALSLIHI